ncbi:MAG: PilN domain-containing protein [Caldisericaceae bacterium]
MEYSIDINLLPGKHKRRKRLSKETKQVISIGVIIFVLLMVVYGGMWYQVFTKTNYLADLNNKIDSLKKVEDALNKRSSLGDTLNYYETTIENLAKSQIDWNSLVSEIGQALPKDAVVETLTADTGKKTVTISGHVPTLQKLAWTVNSLIADENFSNISVDNYTLPLGSQTQQAANKINYATFTISLQWKGMGK